MPSDTASSTLVSLVGVDVGAQPAVLLHGPEVCGQVAAASLVALAEVLVRRVLGVGGCRGGQVDEHLHQPGDLGVVPHDRGEQRCRVRGLPVVREVEARRGGGGSRPRASSFESK